MNKREVKLRALKLCLVVIMRAIDSGDIVNMVDDDTTDEEAERIQEAAGEFRFSLHKRIQSLEANERSNKVSDHAE